MRHALEAAKGLDSKGFELIGARDAGAADAVVLDVLPDPLVGVQLRGVGRDLEQA